MKLRLMFIPRITLAILLFIAIGLAWVMNPALPTSMRKSPINAEPEKLRAHVAFLTGIQPPRSFDNPESLDRVAGYIRAEWNKLGLTVEEKPFEVGGFQYRNLIVHFGPVHGERLVVGAHYDVCDHKPGADDNASGLAGLLELTRLLAKKRDFKMGIDVVAYTLEEPPYFATPNMGSAIHAEKLASQNVQVRAMIGLEMIGYFTEAPGSQQFPSGILKLIYPTQGDFIAVVGNVSSYGWTRTVKKRMARAMQLPVFSLNAPVGFPGIDLSDHRNYWAKGWPAVMITDTAFFRNPNYHTTKDTIDTLNFDKMADVVTGVYTALISE